MEKLTTKSTLNKKDIKCLQILVSHLYDIDTKYQSREDIEQDLDNLAGQIYNLTLDKNSSIG